MNTKKLKSVVYGIAIVVHSFTGCMSVEGMKAKLNSGDARQIEVAHAKILDMALHHNNFVEGSEVCEYINLVKDNDVLWKIHLKAKDSIAKERALQRIKFSSDEETVVFFKNHLEEMYVSRDDEDLCRWIREVKKDGPLTEIWRNVKWPFKSVAASCLTEITTDQDVLLAIANDHDSGGETRKKAASKISKLDYKLKLLSNRICSSHIILTEAEVADYLVKGEWRDGDGNGEVRQDLFNRINDQKLLAKIAVEAKADWCRRDAVHKITDKDVKLDVIRKLIPVWIAKDDNDGYESSTCSMIMRLVTEQDGLRELVKNLGKGKGFYGHKKVIERIADADIADTMFDTMPLRSNDESLDIIKALVQKLSVTKKSKIVSSALERAKVVKDRIVFEAFWVGMPIADFFVLAEHFGIEANAIEYCAGKSGVWHKDYVVSEMAFPSKSCQKFLDCEDADILRQTIHKYVMHKEGKGTVLDYVKLINSEIDHTKTKRFNLMSGFSTKHDFKYWETYSNSKLGTKIWFSEKTGILRFTGL